MAQNPFRKSQLVLFSDAAAGHDGVLSDRSGSTVIKPCKQAEINFYESAATHPEFAGYIPKFMGTLSLLPDRDPASSAAGALTHDPTPLDAALWRLPDTVAEPTWTPSCGAKIATETAIMLENVAGRYQKPNILDLKLGARLWADDAPPAKRERLDKSAAETTSKALGIRIAGMRIWEGSDSEAPADGYRVYDKAYGRALGVETVHEGFEEYFRIKHGDAPGKTIRKVIELFLEDLEGLQAALEKEESRIYSSSLLFVFEGDLAALRKALEGTPSSEILPHPSTPPISLPPSTTSTHSNSSSSSSSSSLSSSSSDSLPLPRIQGLKLIDFAHAAWTPGRGPDENVLHGIRSVIKILRSLL